MSKLKVPLLTRVRVYYPYKIFMRVRYKVLDIYSSSLIIISMKVIFLDIDGVMNSENHAREMHKLVEEGKLSEKKFYSTWDLPYEGTILPLKKIIEQTGASVVLSSSWRLLRGKFEELNKIFGKYGFQMIDRTCHGVALSKLVEIGLDPNKCWDAQYRGFNEEDKWYNTTTSDRGAEIAVWLHEHPEVESFVILDDDWADIEPYYIEEHVQTNFYDWGLTEELADKAIKILNKK